MAGRNSGYHAPDIRIKDEFLAELTVEYKNEFMLRMAERNFFECFFAEIADTFEFPRHEHPCIDSD